MSDNRLDKRMKLSGALPGENGTNGIDWLASTCVADQFGTQILAVAVLDVKEVKTDTDSGSAVPIVRIRSIEGVLLDDAPAAVRGWLDAQRVGRLGAETLPYDDEDEAGLSDPLDDAGLTDAVAVLPADSDNLVRAPFGGRR